jgi:hypothetical protein
MSSSKQNKSAKTTKAETKLQTVSKMLKNNKKNKADKQKSIYTAAYGMKVIRN